MEARQLYLHLVALVAADVVRHADGRVRGHDGQEHTVVAPEEMPSLEKVSVKL